MNIESLTNTLVRLILSRLYAEQKPHTSEAVQYRLDRLADKLADMAMEED